MRRERIQVAVLNCIILLILGSCMLLSGCIGCFTHNPDDLREKTAQATAELKQDAKAVAQGVHEGWTRDHPLDLNHASKEQLLSMPGMSTERANRVIATRPFESTHQLVSRQILSQGEYDRIKDRITAKP